MDLFVVQFLGENQLAGLGLHTHQHASLGYLIHAAVGQHGATCEHGKRMTPQLPILAVGQGKILVFQNRLSLAGSGKLGRQLEADHTAFLGGIDVFLSVNAHQHAVMNDHAGVHSTL